MKKIWILLIIIPLITGCSSYTELNDLGIVSLLGIDYQNNKYQVYVTIIEGKQDDGALEKEQTFFHSEANNLEEAFQKITLQSDKKLYLSHVDSLLITKDLINYKLKDTLSNFLNNNESRNNFNIVLVKENISLFFKQKITAEQINKLIEINHHQSGIITEIDFESFLKNLLIDTNSMIPTISYYDDHLEIEGFTLIKDFKVLETLTKEESFIINLLSNKVTHAIWKDATIYESESIIKTNKNKITISIHITTDQPTLIKKELKEKSKSLLLYYQNKNYDLLKLQNKIKQNDYSYFKKTNNLLEKIEFNIKIKTKEKNNYIEED